MIRFYVFQCPSLLSLSLSLTHSLSLPTKPTLLISFSPVLYYTVCTILCCALYNCLLCFSVCIYNNTNTCSTLSPASACVRYIGELVWWPVIITWYVCSMSTNVVACVVIIMVEWLHVWEGNGFIIIVYHNNNVWTCWLQTTIINFVNHISYSHRAVF